MKRKKTTDEKVVEFAQSETKTKIFRRDYPVCDELRKIMVYDVFNDFMKFALDQFYADYVPILETFVADHDPQEKKRFCLQDNLFWWRILYDASLDLELNCIEDYISDRYHSLMKRPILISWLRECAKVVPKFYFISHKYDDHVFTAVDILEEKPLDIIVYDPHAVAPKKGEIVMGTLIPLGNCLYFPIMDFYHFDFEARKEIASHLMYYYNKYLKTSTMHEAFIHVLSAMLQIERCIFIENQKNSS